MKPISDQLFTFTHPGTPTLAYERCTAADLGLQESWLRDAIFKVPELVIGPCRAAGLTEDEWYPWQFEYPVEVGSIDVLLISAQGRVAIVETKLASNKDRRRVLAQVLDYLAHLADALDEKMPGIPKGEGGEPVADREDVRESVSQGDVLVIIASDDIDPRVAKLSRSLLLDHIVNQWDLALVDLALFRPVGNASGNWVIVPSVRRLVESEPRQVVRVVVEGQTPEDVVKVTFERIGDGGPSVPTGPSVRQKWDEKRFFDNLEAGEAPQSVRQLASQLRELARSFPDSVVLVWGTGKEGSMVVKRRAGGLIEVYGSGRIRFRPQKFGRALGDDGGGEYRRRLEQLVPDAMRMEYPHLAPADAAKVAPALYELVREALGRVERDGGTK